MIVSTAPAVAPGTLLERGHALLGLVAFLVLCHLIGRVYSKAGRVPWRVVGWGVGLAFAFGSIVIYVPTLLPAVQDAIQKLLDFTVVGAQLVFGNLATQAGPPVNDAAGHPTGQIANTGAMVAFVVLPTIVFVSMLTAILYRLHVLGWVVNGLAWVMRRTMGTSGAETLSTAANIFVGQTEAPLIVKPFLAAATRSELMAIMVGGFANIASGVIVVYTGWLKDYVQNAGGHLAAACFVSAPVTLVVAKLILPETETPATVDAVGHDVRQVDANLIDAATRGVSEGLTLAINVGAMLLAFTALVALLNAVIGWGFLKAGVADMTMQRLLGYVCAPVAWLCGVPWRECTKVGALLGVKTILNELIAYRQLADAYAVDASYLSPRAGLLTTYALCGFANIASVGIQIGGISVLAPERRGDLSRLGFMAMLGGAIASCIGACVIGVLV